MIRTHVGPRPPTKPTDTRTFVWSRCHDCGWLAVHIEEHSMAHTIDVAEHVCPDVVQLELFGGAA